jgi:drug/metabolite transporter (DMT)-like permease
VLYSGRRGEGRLQPTTRRLFSVAVLINVLSVVGFVLAYVFQWPSEFVTGEVTEHNVTLADIVSGTVTSIPLAPWIALIVFALLARSRRWWGTLAVVVLCLLGVVFMIGGYGEVSTPPTPYVPRAVLITAGVVFGVLGLSLVVAGVIDLTDRAQQMRRPSRVR